MDNEVAPSFALADKSVLILNIITLLIVESRFKFN